MTLGQNAKPMKPMKLFRAMILWGCVLCAFPAAKAEEDRDFLRGCELYQHGKGNPEHYSEALRHFMKSAERGHAQSQFYVGRMNHMEPSVGIDLEAAKKWYRLAGEHGDSRGWNNLGSLYKDTGGPNHLILEHYSRSAELDNEQAHYNLGLAYRYGRLGLPIHPDKAMFQLQKAAELGQPFGGWAVGMIYRDGWRTVNPDKLKAAYYFSLGAKKRNGCAIWWLGELLRDSEVGKQLDAATLKEWKDLCANYRNQVDQEVKAVLAKVRIDYEEGNPKVAQQNLDEAFKRWASLTVDSYDYHYCEAIWDEAQFRNGRTDIEWSIFLYSYLYDQYERNGFEAEHSLHARSQIHDGLVELGQYGLLRQSIEVSKRLIRRCEKIDVDAVLARANVSTDYLVIGAESLPLFVNHGDGGKNTSGDFIGGIAMNALENLADERLAVGDWKTALILAEWWHRWSDAFRKAGVTPKRSYPGFEGEFEQLPMEMRMRAFYALGLPEREAEAARQIVVMNSKSYGGRRLHKARLRLFDLMADQGRSQEIDLEELESLEEEIRSNIAAEAHKWKFAKLVRAKVIAKTRGLDEGLPLVREVLEETKDDVLGPLRLEALLVAAQLSVEAGVTDGVAELLSEALESARSRGLLLQEMRVYQLYVDYLLATHQYDAAIEMQNRVIDLIKALKLAPRLEGALARLERIISLQQNRHSDALTGEPAAADSTPPDQVASGVPDKDEDKTPSSSDRHVDSRSSLTLQPRGIRSRPITEDTSSVFLLSNLSTKPARGSLKVASDQLRLSLEEEPGEQATVVCKLGEEGISQPLDFQVDVPGGGQIPIVLIAEGIASLSEGSVTISLLGDSSGFITAQDSQWVIQRDSEAGIIAVVDAALLTDSNFSLVPVFHHLNSTTTEHPAVLRVVASEPTRVEGFAADGSLLFIDAQGNGSFEDSGDLIATEEMAGLNPVLKAGPESGRIALRYRPHSKSLSRKVKIRIETREITETAAWKLDAIDWLEP